MWRTIHRAGPRFISPFVSPLPANIYLDALDRELERRGHTFWRYADDRASRHRPNGPRHIETVNKNDMHYQLFAIDLNRRVQHTLLKSSRS